MDYTRDPANAGTKGRGSKREQLVGDNWATRATWTVYMWLLGVWW